MKLWGVTGNLASGKSQVTDLLTSMLQAGGYKVACFDADRAFHALLRDKLEERSIQNVLGLNSQASPTERRVQYKRKVFAREISLQYIEQLFYPTLYEEARNAKKSAEQTRTDVLIWDVPRLIEAQWHKDCDETLLVVCEPHLMKERFFEREIKKENPLLSPIADACRTKKIEQAWQFFEQYFESPQQRRQAATQCFDNSGSLEDLQRQIRSWLTEQGYHLCKS